MKRRPTKDFCYFRQEPFLKGSPFLTFFEGFFITLMSSSQHQLVLIIHIYDDGVYSFFFYLGLVFSGVFIPLIRQTLNQEDQFEKSTKCEPNHKLQMFTNRPIIHLVCVLFPSLKKRMKFRFRGGLGTG